MESKFSFFVWLIWSYPKEMTLEGPERRAILEANHQKFKSNPEDLSWAWPLSPGGLRFLFQDVFYSKCILLHIHIKPHSKSKVKIICDLWPAKMFVPDVLQMVDDWKVTPCSCDAFAPLRSWLLRGESTFCSSHDPTHTRTYAAWVATDFSTEKWDLVKGVGNPGKLWRDCVWWKCGLRVKLLIDVS